MQMQKIDKASAEPIDEDVFSKFIELENEKTTLTKIDNASNQELLQRDKSAIQFLEKALNHINVYDSLETAAKLISQARNVTSSYAVKAELVNARKNLLGAHKATKKRFKPHYTKVQREQVKHNAINAAITCISDAIMALKIEEDKRTGHLFNNLTTRATVDLPTRVKNAKAKFLIREAPVVVSTTKGYPMNLKISKLETGLFLVYGATFIGVCVNNIKGTAIDFARAKAMEKFGCDIYEEAVYRPSDGLQWFLVINFNCGINYAAFPDYVRASYANFSDSEQNFSYEDYVKGILAKEMLEQAMKAERIKNIREAFEQKHKELYDLIAQKKKLITFKRDQIEALKLSFFKITSLEDGESDGLKSNQYNTQFEKRFMEIALDNYLHSPLNFRSLSQDIRNQRIQAREIYYTIRMLLDDINDINKSIDVINSQIATLKRQEAIKHGMIGNKATVLELEAA